MDAGLALGLGIGPPVSFTVGGSFGYFVVDGLELGLGSAVTFGPDQDTVIELMPYVRWVFWRAYPISPYVRVRGGRLFIIDNIDVSVVGASVGAVLFAGRHFGIQAEGGFQYLFPDEGLCPGDDTCLVPVFGLNVGFFFQPGSFAIGGIDDDDDDEEVE